MSVSHYSLHLSTVVQNSFLSSSCRGGDLGSTYESEYCSWWFEGGVSSSYTQQMETPKRIGSFFEFSTIAPNVINSMSLAF